MVGVACYVEQPVAGLCDDGVEFIDLVVCEAELSANDVGACAAVYDDFGVGCAGGSVVEGAIVGDGEGLVENAGIEGEVDVVFVVSKPGGVVEVGG